MGGMGAARQRAAGEPAWARRFPDTAEGMERTASHEQARKLPRDTDPDTIDDPGVREAFLDELNDEESREPASEPSRRPAGATATGRSLVRGFSAPASVGSAVGGGLVYAVLLNYVRGGPAQVKAWFAAKLTNGHGALP